MPRVCSVPGCKSNYRKSLKTQQYLATYKFPKDENLRTQWKNSINMKKEITKFSAVCELHFTEEDIINFKNRTRLKVNAVPKKNSNSFPLLKKQILNDITSGKMDENIPKSNFVVEEIHIKEKAIYKHSSVQCNLFKEIWMDSIENKVSLSNCSCIGNFFENLDRPKVNLTVHMEKSTINENTAEEFLDDDFQIQNLIYENDSSTEINDNTTDDDVFEFDSNYQSKIYENIYIQLPNGSYECNKCDKICSNLAAHKAHIDSHLEQSLICSKCGKIFDTHKKTLMHDKRCSVILESTDKIQQNKICPDCKQIFNKSIEYFDHLYIHKNIKPYQCSCRQEFTRYTNFITHLKKFKCSMEECIIPDYAPRPNYNSINNETIKYRLVNILTCRICENIFEKAQFRKHFLNKSHYSFEKNWITKFNINKFSCIYCTVHFKKLSDCIKHHCNAHRKFPDDEFLKSFEIAGQNLEDKSIEITPISEICRICKLEYDKNDFLTHFSDKFHKNLEEEWYEIHSLINIKCLHCTDEFTNLFECARHRKEFHNVASDNKFIKNLEMNYSFSQNNSRNRDQNKHSHYFCEECNKYFTKRLNYFDHISGHNNRKCYICSCGASMRHYSSFVSHIFKFGCAIEGRIVPYYAPKTFTLQNN